MGSELERLMQKERLVDAGRQRDCGHWIKLLRFMRRDRARAGEERVRR